MMHPFRFLNKILEDQFRLQFQKIWKEMYYSGSGFFAKNQTRLARFRAYSPLN